MPRLGFAGLRGAAVCVGVLCFVACAGEEPAPQPPPTPAPATAATANVTPAAETAPPASPKPPLADLIAQTLAGMQDAFNAHDPKKVASYCTEDCVVVEYGQLESHGRDEVATRIQGLFDAVGDARCAALRTWLGGSGGSRDSNGSNEHVVVSEIAWAGTMTGDFKGIKATNKPVGQVSARVLWFGEDGLLKAMHVYADGAGLMAQMAGTKGAPPVPLLPTNSPEIHVSQGSPEGDNLVDWAKGTDATMSKDDPETALGQFADDGDCWVNFSGTTATRGKKENEKALARFFKAFPDQKWTSVNAWDIAGFAILEHTMSGTQKGPIATHHGTGKPVTDWHWLDILQPSAEGKIQHGWGYANLVELMKQTGDSKPEDRAAAKVAPAATKKK
jgi:hypothetical protein